MLKPTSILNFRILEFLMKDTKLCKELKLRDTHKDAAIRELKVKFERHLTSTKTGYRVDFVYATRFPNLEKNDDIVVYIEVTEGNELKFKIVKIVFN